MISSIGVVFRSVSGKYCRYIIVTAYARKKIGIMATDMLGLFSIECILVRKIYSTWIIVEIIL